MKLSSLLGIVPDPVYVRIYDRSGDVCYFDNKYPTENWLLKSNVISVYPNLTSIDARTIYIELSVHIDSLTF